jgi:hypothetical protein
MSVDRPLQLTGDMTAFQKSNEGKRETGPFWQLLELMTWKRSTDRAPNGMREIFRPLG